MYPRNLIAISTLLAGGQCFGAAAPVASITSSANLTVNGIAVPANRVSWPVSVNDEIVTQSSTARLRFPDGSTVTLQRNSRARIESASSRVEVKMLSGSAIYDVKKTSTVGVTASAPSSEAAAALAAAAPREAAAASVAAAAPYRMAAPSASGASSGMIIAPQAVSAGSFTAAGDSRQAITTVGTGPRIELPSGHVLEVTSLGNNTYRIDKINFKTVAPNGDVTYITPAATILVGATLTMQPPAENQVAFTVTLPGQSTPLTPNGLGVTVDNALLNAFRNTTGLPAGTGRPSYNAVSSGVFNPATVVSPPGT